ncbi:MAG TPA: hypothetical protein VNA24_08540 [Hyalangium sp.]|nr:hypothetical protein [Hyalangium sp.]
MRLREIFTSRRKAPAPKQEPLHLQVLFPQPVWLSADALMGRLREFHPSLAQARAEIMTGALIPGSDQLAQLARVWWDKHRVHIGFFPEPMPPGMLEQNIDFALYDEGLKARARAHTAHAVLVYKGEEKDPLEQYGVLAKIVAALVQLGAIVAVNPNGFTSYPAHDLTAHPGEDLDEVLRTLPLMALFVGFARFTVEGYPGIWIRTTGAPLLDLPDLAMHTRDHEDVAHAFLMFKNIFAAMRDSGVKFKEGDMVDDGERQWKFRKPRSKEQFLYSSRMIVLERDPNGIRLP